jgi:methyl-accepting chemotaxis protein
MFLGVVADMQCRGYIRPGPGVNMDLDEAIATHSKWKHKLRQSLAKHDGSLRPSEVSLDHKCVLGQWIYGEGASHSSLPEYAKLKYEHARFHLIAAEIVKKANSGKSIDAEIAPCSNSEFSTSSSAIVIVLMAMKKQLSQ